MSRPLEKPARPANRLGFGDACAYIRAVRAALLRAVASPPLPWQACRHSFSSRAAVPLTLWFMLALMTAAAVFAVLWPLSRRAPRAPGVANDVAVYRDQLDELARDRDGGRIGGAEAEAARVEIARRLLAADETVRTRDDGHSRRHVDTRRRVVAVLALFIVPAFAASLYLAFGNPTLPGAPVAQVQAAAPERQSITALVSQVEKHLERNPEDGRGWEVVAPVYTRMGRLDDAVRARRNVLRLLGATAGREADFGEALTLAANGVVTAEARGAFERATAADATDVKARYFLGLAAEQDGKPQQAGDIWRKLLAEAPGDAPWRGFLQQALARVGGAPQMTGPSEDEVEAAASLPPEQRAQMIHGMVDRLAARLKQDGTDLAGWERLLRSYTTLGESDKAKAAAVDARQALSGDEQKLSRINALIRQLGLES